MTFGTGGRRVHTAHRRTSGPLDAAAGAGQGAKRSVVGGKGQALAAMAGIGLPVPPAFCVSTEWCEDCALDPVDVVDGMWEEVLGGLKWLERRTGQTFGGGRRPLLLAVRSSGVTSMPGMLETVLDVGIDDAVVRALGQTHSEAFARDTRERFLRGYRRAVSTDGAVPAEPRAQLRGAIEAVVSSWSSRRVAAYRAHHGLPQPESIAILLQAMVFGNLDRQSGTGVLAALAAVGVGSAVLLRDGTPGTPAGTAVSSSISAPRAPGGVPLPDDEILTLLTQPADPGPLAAPQRLASCLSGLGYAMSTSPLGARSLAVNGRPGVLLLLAGDLPRRINAVVVAPNCSSIDTGLLASTVLNRP